MRGGLLIGPSVIPPASSDRLPIYIHPDVRDQLGSLLFEPEMQAVGYSEFIARAILTAQGEIAWSRENVIGLQEDTR